MTTESKKQIEIFSAGCPVCDETIALVSQLACPSCEIEVLDMQKPPVAARASGYGIRRLPSVVIDGKLASCCSGNGAVDAELLSVGLGQS